MVSKYWKDISEDNWLWNHKLQNDALDWMFITNASSPSLLQKRNESLSFKEIYLQSVRNANETCKMLCASRNPLKKLYHLLFRPRDAAKVVFFGPGLESFNSISSVIGRILRKQSTFKTHGMFPGKFEGYGTGFHMSLEQNGFLHYFDMVTLYTCSKRERELVTPDKRMNVNRLVDREPEQSVVKPVRDLCRTVNGFVFAVDVQTSNDISFASEELRALVRDDDIDPRVPLIILCCTFDAPPMLSITDVEEQLSLDDFQRPWRVQKCDVENLQSLEIALLWLLSKTSDY